MAAVIITAVSVAATEARDTSPAAMVQTVRHAAARDATMRALVAGVLATDLASAAFAAGNRPRLLNHHFTPGNARMDLQSHKSRQEDDAHKKGRLEKALNRRLCAHPSKVLLK